MSSGLQHDWAELLERSLVDLEHRVRQQRALVRAAAGDGAERPQCPLVDCERVTRLRAALTEAIGVLEQTRSSFKSRQLEQLRKRLVEVLAGS